MHFYCSTKVIIFDKCVSYILKYNIICKYITNTFIKNYHNVIIR